MITIEVLISMIILLLVIATSITMIKQLRIVEEKEKKYENLYLIMNNIYTFLDDNICDKELLYRDISYDIQCHLIYKKKYTRFRKTDEDDNDMNRINLFFYKVVISFSIGNQKKIFSLYKMITKKPK